MSDSEQIRPVVVLSPLQRSGTTLVQRLLCSAPNALIYGDNVGQEIEFFAKYAQARQAMLGFQQSQFSPVREAVLRGDVSDFITPLAPTMKTHVSGFGAAARAWLKGCQEEAAESGRDVWGWKLAGADASTLSFLVEWFPEARWIWIERDLIDCLRSAKAVEMFCGAAEAAVFAQRAAASREVFSNLQLNHVLRLDYGAMTADPESMLRLIENFTGAVGMDVTVFERRVNQLGCATRILPVNLTDEEMAAIIPFSTAA
jgi:hypothetical protein